MNLKLSVRNIEKSFGQKKVLTGCTHAFGSGITVIMGPNGTGKSTFLRICALLEPPTSGRLGFFYTKDKILPMDNKLMRKITLVFPKPGIFNASVWKNVTYGLRVRGIKRRDIARRAKDMLDAVKLYDKRKQNALGLSGGEAQRLSLARAIVMEPQVLLIDEPTANIDEENSAIVEKIILGLKKQSAPPTIVLATQDRAQAERFSEKILLLKQGKLVLTGATYEHDTMAEPEETEDKRGYFVDKRFFK